MTFLTQDWKDAPRDSNDLEDEAVQVAFRDVPSCGNILEDFRSRICFEYLRYSYRRYSKSLFETELNNHSGSDSG